MTKAQTVEWLAAHNGEGVFMAWPSHAVLLAAGERAPVMRGTWNRLRDQGVVTIVGGRVKLKPAVT